MNYKDKKLLLNLPYKVSYCYDNSSGIFTVYFEDYTDISAKSTSYRTAYLEIMSKLEKKILNNEVHPRLHPALGLNVKYMDSKGDLCIVDSIAELNNCKKSLFVIYHREDDEKNIKADSIDSFFSRVGTGKSCEFRYRKVA